jgi:hypothetical protein
MLAAMMATPPMGQKTTSQVGCPDVCAPARLLACIKLRPNSKRITLYRLASHTKQHIHHHERFGKFKKKNI